MSLCAYVHLFISTYVCEFVTVTAPVCMHNSAVTEAVIHSYCQRVTQHIDAGVCVCATVCVNRVITERKRQHPSCVAARHVCFRLCLVRVCLGCECVTASVCMYNSTVIEAVAHSLSHTPYIPTDSPCIIDALAPQLHFKANSNKKSKI